MSEFGWTRLAYLTVVLSVLAVLVKLGTFGVNALPEDFPEAAFAFTGKESAETAAEQTTEERHHQGVHEGEHAEETASRSVSEDLEYADLEQEGDHSHEPVESLYESVDFEEDPPVFYRPAPRVSSAGRVPSSSGTDEKSCQNLSDAPPGSKILFPLTREHFDSYDDTWGAARPQGGHEGTDLMVPTGTPELAITDGTVVPVAGANENGWNTLGGYTVMIEAAYSVGPVKKGDLFYYAHMDEKSDLRIGDTVKAGDVVGYAGDTGQGPEVSRGRFPPHLHLGWYETSGERTQLASGAMNPYPLLEWVKANGGSIAGGSDIPYCEAPRSTAPVPSTGGGYWQFPSDPGVRPDMSTGTNSAAPSPIVEQSDSAESSPDIPRERRQPPVRQDRPDRPDRPANPAPPEEDDDTDEPTSSGPPDAPPSLTNPLPEDIGDDIRDVIGGILNPGNPRSPENSGEATEPATPTPPSEDADDPEKTGSPTAPESPPKETNTHEDPEETTTKDPEGKDPEESPECDPRKRPNKKATNEETTARPNEDCHEDTASGEDSPPEETAPDKTGEESVENSDDPVTEQYESEPETTDEVSGASDDLSVEITSEP